MKERKCEFLLANFPDISIIIEAFKRAKVNWCFLITNRITEENLVREKMFHATFFLLQVSGSFNLSSWTRSIINPQSKILPYPTLKLNQKLTHLKINHLLFPKSIINPQSKIYNPHQFPKLLPNKIKQRWKKTIFKLSDAE